jgi:ATP-dependent helicase/nuclease subunit A
VPYVLPDTDAVIFAFRRNVVVAASAGTGKTHRLTALYLLLVLGLTSMGERDDRTAAAPVGPERIVATTFSRAAAREIEARIELALREIVAWDGEAPLRFELPIRARADRVGVELGVSDLKRRAADALARWPSAKIDTLHGVARRLVLRHALAIGLPPGTRVLDEEEADELGDLAVDEALSAALAAGGARADAARGLLISTGGVWATRQRVRRLLDRLDEEGLRPRDLTLADHLAEARVAADALREVARRLAALGSNVFREPAAALADALATRAGDELLPERAAAAVIDLFARRMPARGRRLPPDDELDELIGSLPGKTKAERAGSLVALLRTAPALSAREVEIAALLEDARDRLAAQKRRAGALGFGDLLRLSRDALRDRPEVARSAREDLDVLLVDEFQDTSRVQRDLVYLLREREDAAAARAPGAPPTAAGLTGHGLFLVGDRKQSIYGFRGADVAVFSRIAGELCGRAAGEALALPEAAWAGVVESADFVALRESRRSGEAILSFVNAFSERDFAADRQGAAPRAFEITYGPAEHLVAAEGAPSSRVTLVQDDGSSPEGADPIVREAQGAAREAHVAAAFVANLVQPPDESPLLDEPPRYQDVAILARRRSTIPLVEIALSRLDIPYVVAGRALYDAPEVRDVAALLRLLLDPRDRLALATVLRGPMVALSDTALTELSLPGRGLAVPLLGRWPSVKASADPAAPPPEVVDPARLPPAERARLEVFRSRFTEIRRAALRLPPGEAIRAALAAFDLDRVLCALPRAEARLGNLDRLVTIARRRGGTLAGFVRWLERRIRDDADEAEAAVFSPEDDAVRLTTIHASKGLDFKAVVLVDLNAEPRADGGALGFVSTDAALTPTLVVRHYAARGKDRALTSLQTTTLKASQIDARAREQAERRRLTYVALTRARHTLALISAMSPPRPGSALRSIAAGMEEGDLAGVVTTVAQAAELLATARPAPPPHPHASEASEARGHPRPPIAPVEEVAIAATALGLFRDCPRRFRLRHLLGIEEPASAGQLDLFAAAAAPEPIVDLPPPRADDPAEAPRVLDRAAHRALARWPAAAWGQPTDPVAMAARLGAEGLPVADAETVRLAQALARFLAGPYAVAAAGAAIRGAEAFVATAAMSGRPPRRLLLHGTADVRVAWPDGRIDVIEVRAGRPREGLAKEAFALRAAALATARSHPEARVRAGILFLGGAAEPVFLRGSGPEGSLDEAEMARFETDLGTIAGRYAEARYDDRWEATPVATCRKLGCGFVGSCHGAAAGDPAG